jgi:hypothetical protein
LCIYFLCDFHREIYPHEFIKFKFELIPIWFQ